MGWWPHSSSRQCVAGSQPGGFDDSHVRVNGPAGKPAGVSGARRDHHARGKDPGGRDYSAQNACLLPLGHQAVLYVWVSADKGFDLLGGASRGIVSTPASASWERGVVILE